MTRPVRITLRHVGYRSTRTRVPGSEFAAAGCEPIPFGTAIALVARIAGDGTRLGGSTAGLTASLLYTSPGATG